MAKVRKNLLLKVFLVGLFLIILNSFFVFAYDSGWQNWRIKSDYVVCGQNYQKCSNSLLGVDWFRENNGKRGYGMICGESSSKFGCLHWGNAAIGRNFPLSSGSYYLIIKNYFDNTGVEDNENFVAGISSSFGANGRNGIDLGGGYKSCVFKNTFQGNSNSKVWISGPQNSFNSVQFRITSCIPNEGLVYCEDGSSAVPNCVSCTPNLVNTSWSSWENLTCSGNQMKQRRFRVQYDSNNCGTIQNQTFYEERFVGPNYINTSWSDWGNITSCRANNTILQSRNLISYDFFSCAPNITYIDYREIPCQFCTPSIRFTEWSDWFNLQCINSTHRNQARIRIEYDENNCGSFQNITHYEYRIIEDQSCFSQQIGNLFIAINSPLNITYNNSLILVNITSNGSSVWYNWNGTNVSYFSPLFVNFSEGINVLHAWASNGTNQVYANVSFYVNLSSQQNGTNMSNQIPTIYIHSPLNNTNYTTSTIWLNVSSNQIINNWFYNINGTNISFIPNITLNLSNGCYNLIVYGNNSNGTGSNSVNFCVNFSSQRDNQDNERENKIKKDIGNRYVEKDSQVSLILKNESVLSLTKKSHLKKDKSLEEIWIINIFLISFIILLFILITIILNRKW